MSHLRQTIPESRINGTARGVGSYATLQVQLLFENVQDAVSTEGSQEDAHRGSRVSHLRAEVSEAPGLTTTSDPLAQHGREEVHLRLLRQTVQTQIRHPRAYQ